MNTIKVHTYPSQLQRSTIIPFRYRTLLYLNIFLLAIDLCINTFGEYLAANKYEQLIIFIVQDVCIVLSITLLIVMILTTYVAQAGLLCLLLRMFGFSMIVACIYFLLCAAIQILILLSRFPSDTFNMNTFSKTEILVLYIIQRTFSAFYYYAMKRAAYRLSDPHFYQSSKWLQNIWEKRRMAVTNVTMHASQSGMTTSRCICCAIQ
ncbi:unnamed protein product [Adineta steineri]|uniref:Transmembrane protein 138 n=1 Tax=Adineta steineri TaxID=433720 RepID=A0A815ISE1_9BILA|nr:unnamed protein product [Adineta steineri]CAF3701448.1 unnamed protein product [Adineta steineri]